MRTILHLCADTGSDTKPYQDDPRYRVIRVGKDVGVENFHWTGGPVQGVIANPVCLEFSRARQGGKARDPAAGMAMVKECQRIIREVAPKWWGIENPAMGLLRNYLGKHEEPRE